MVFGKIFLEIIIPVSNLSCLKAYMSLSNHLMKEAYMCEVQELKPEALEIEKSQKASWDYDKSIKEVKALYLSWKTVSNELLQELWVAKQAITLNGARSNGRTKKGEVSWSAYIKECFGGAISKRSIDNYLAMYTNAGMTKPSKPEVISDHSKLEVRNIKQDGDRITFDIYLPEHNVSYAQAIHI